MPDFTTGRPWLRFGPDVATRNVETQRRDPGSVLSFYRRLIALRAVTPALQIGTLRFQHGLEVGVVAYTRELAGQVALVALNIGRDPVTWRLPDAPGQGGWRAVLTTAATEPSTERLAAGSATVLAADGAVIFEGID